MADSTPMNVCVQNGKVTIESGEIIVTGGATEAKQDTQITNQNTELTKLGTEGAAPPVIPGTGIMGYLRSAYDKLVEIYTTLTGTLSVTFTNTTIDVDVKNKPDVSVPDGVDVNNFPSGFNVNNIPHTIVDSGSINATVSGSVSVSNFPATQNVAVTNIPHVIVDSGAITATVSGTASVNQVQGTNTLYRNTALSITPQQVKGTAGSIIKFFAVNLNTQTTTLKFYDKATTPTVGTDPVLFSFLIDGGSLTGQSTKGVLEGDNHLGFINFTNKLWVAATRNLADTDATTPNNAINVQIITS